MSPILGTPHWSWFVTMGFDVFWSFIKAHLQREVCQWELGAVRQRHGLALQIVAKDDGRGVYCALMAGTSPKFSPVFGRFTLGWYGEWVMNGLDWLSVKVRFRRLSDVLYSGEFWATSRNLTPSKINSFSNFIRSKNLTWKLEPIKRNTKPAGKSSSQTSFLEFHVTFRGCKPLATYDPGRPRRFCTAPWPHPKKALRCVSRNVVKPGEGAQKWLAVSKTLVYDCVCLHLHPFSSEKGDDHPMWQLDTFLFRDWVA